MRLAACYFDSSDPRGKWARLARVLEASAREHVPHWQRTIQPLPVTVGLADANLRTVAANTAKLRWWAEQVEGAAEGERLLLIDADTLILRGLDDVWQRPFSVAITTKRETGAKFPINGGVVFVRVSAATRAFFRAWRDINDHLAADPVAFQRSAARDRFGGINQAALGRLLAADVLDHVLELPCQEFNCEDHSWATFDPTVTRILHIKSALRLACFHPWARTPELRALADRWIDAERRAFTEPQPV